jgi:hypothetical protein
LYRTWQDEVAEILYSGARSLLAERSKRIEIIN